MTIKELKEKIATLKAVYQKNKLEVFLLSRSPKIKQIKEDIANSSLPYNELIKHIPLSLQLEIDMILLPPNNPLKLEYVTISEFEECVKHGDYLSINFWKINKKLARGNLTQKPFNNVFHNFNFNSNGSITLEPLNFIELAKTNINQAQIPVDKLSERQLYYALCSTIPYSNEAVKKMIDAITYAYEKGNKETALYNISALSLMCNQFNLRIYGNKNHSLFMGQSKTLLIADNDDYNGCLHELGHAIHFLLLGRVTPPDFLRLYNLCQVNMKQNEEAFQILISALNNYYLSANKQVENKKDNIREMAVDEKLDEVIENQLKEMDNDALKQLISKYVLPTFHQQYFEMLETNKPKLLNSLKMAILNYSVNQIAEANYQHEEVPGFGLDALSGIIPGFKIKFRNGITAELLTGHEHDYYANNPHNMFAEMIANYNICRAYGDNVAIKQLKKTIGTELFNYLENIYDGYLSGLNRESKNSSFSKNNTSFEKFYIEALNTSDLSIDKKQELLTSLNRAIYEDENQILYKLYNSLLPEFKFKQTQAHFINFLANPNYFKNNEHLRIFLSPEFLDELESNVNFGKLREFITQNFSDVSKHEGFNIIIQKNEANNKCALYEGEPSYKLINGYCRRFKSYYTTFGIKISIDERYKNENVYESLITALEMFSILQVEFPSNIKEIQISTQFENSLVDGVLFLKSIIDLSDEIVKYTTDEKKY